MIGQNLLDIADPESAAEITDCLKPSIVPSLARSGGVEESTVSQFRQFYVKFRPPSKSSTCPVSVMCTLDPRPTLSQHCSVSYRETLYYVKIHVHVAL